MQHATSDSIVRPSEALAKPELGMRGPPPREEGPQSHRFARGSARPIVTNANIVSAAANREVQPDHAALTAVLRDLADGGIAKAAPVPSDGAWLDFSCDKMIGRFELIRELARGGMGQVFLGRDPKLGRKVAIKFLLRDDPHFAQRFVVEARATARCTHENIVTIFEVGEHEGLPYMVLEYLEGKTLGEVLQGKPSVRQFVEVMVPVARALERAHEHGIVHLDLKPSNIFVTDRGQVKVLDFGVARLVDRVGTVADRPAAVIDARDLDDDDSWATFARSNLVVGTLPYMSPEQWGAGVVDHLSDLWAFGVTFWRALAGVHPVGTMAPEKLCARLRDLDSPLPSIALHAPTLPPEIVAIVDRCLSKRKPERYQSATELLADLLAFLAPKADRASREDCPYRGLAAFGEADVKYFFGRRNEIRTAVAQLDGWPLLAVVGPSGVGKSSFVHAGLVPAIRATGEAWHIHVLRPGRSPIDRLAAALADAHATDEHLPVLAQQLLDAPGLFGATLRAVAARRGLRVLIVVDQLEELFTLCDSDHVRGQFLAALLAAADDRTSPIRVVLSMRADFLDRLDGHEAFLAELSRGLMFLSAPGRDDLREAVMRPAELAGYEFEDPWIVEDMLEAATSRGALPLLSFAATRLWDSRDRQRRLMTIAAYNEMGGVGGAFARHADQVAAGVPTSGQRLLRGIMTRLVTPEGTRAVVDHQELLSLADDQREVERILDLLVNARLIHVHSDADHVPTVEIVHEMLISEWPTLRRWREDGQALRGFLQELRQAAKQWAARGRPNDLVWRGATALDALRHTSRHVLELSVAEKTFVAAIKRQLARTRRRRVIVLVAILSAFGLVLAGGSIAVVEIKLAEREARDKAATAEHALVEAKTARDALQGKLDIIETERTARVTAEARRVDEERLRRAAERVATIAKGAELLSKEQLERANQELRRKVREAQAAKDEARAAAAAAHRSTVEATNAKLATERLLAKERAARAKLRLELRQIDQRELK